MILKLLHINIQGLQCKLADIKELIQTHDPDFITINETFLYQNRPSKITFDGYMVKDLRRPKNQHEGVILAYRDTNKHSKTTKKLQLRETNTFSQNSF